MQHRDKVFAVSKTVFNCQVSSASPGSRNGSHCRLDYYPTIILTLQRTRKVHQESVQDRRISSRQPQLCTGMYMYIHVYKPPPPHTVQALGKWDCAQAHTRKNTADNTTGDLIQKSQTVSRHISGHLSNILIRYTWALMHGPSQYSPTQITRLQAWLDV